MSKKTIIHKVVRRLKKNIKEAFSKKEPKIFCIGNNKTGTTSLQQFFKDHGYNVAPQRPFEKLADEYINRNWEPIIQLCKKYQVFQDVPFSNKFMYIILHHAFPNAKFILSVRDSSEQWYNSITKFHAKKFGQNGNLATKEDLANAIYVEKGWMWKTFREKYGNFEDSYNKERLIAYYESYNNDVRNYFKNNPNFLEVNVGDVSAVEKLSSFLNIKPKYSKFPHRNKT